MIAAELAQRGLVQLKQNLAEFLGFRIAGRKALSVDLSQRADQGVSVLMADLAILVAVAIVETWHFSLPWAVAVESSICLIEGVGNAATIFCNWRASSRLASPDPRTFMDPYPDLATMGR